MSAGVGTRGGPDPPMTIEHARALFAAWKSDEWGWLNARIIWLAWKKGEFHADQLADVQLSERNIIGAVVNGLTRRKLLTSTGEHRRGASAASHGRRSYVYRCTERGRHLGDILDAFIRDRPQELPKRPEQRVEPQQDALFEPPPAPPRRPQGAYED